MMKACKLHNTRYNFIRIGLLVSGFVTFVFDIIA